MSDFPSDQVPLLFVEKFPEPESHERYLQTNKNAKSLNVGMAAQPNQGNETVIGEGRSARSEKRLF